MLSAISGLVGVVVGWLLNYWTTIWRDERRTRQERITAANTLLAEIDMIKERLLSVNLSGWPERPKRDYNKALYHSLQPRLGLFRKETVRALVRFYQGVELIEAKEFACDIEESSVRRKGYREEWAHAVENAQKNLLTEVDKALNAELKSP